MRVRGTSDGGDMHARILSLVDDVYSHQGPETYARATAMAGG